MKADWFEAPPVAVAVIERLHGLLGVRPVGYRAVSPDGERFVLYHVVEAFWGGRVVAFVATPEGWAGSLALGERKVRAPAATMP